MSEAFFSQFPAIHRAAMASTLPDSIVRTDHLGTTVDVTLPRTFEPSPLLTTPANVVSPSAPFSHIFFAALSASQNKILDTRTVLISVDGACAGNSTPTARAGLGIYFGPGSTHNVSQRITDGAQTSQRAEILAASTALRKASVLFAENISVDTIVLPSDSQYVVGAMTEWVFRWKENEWKNAAGKSVRNKREFQELDEFIEQVEEDHRLAVRFWLVRREDNARADELAKAACASSEV